jgi:hypothetical protein
MARLHIVREANGLVSLSIELDRELEGMNQAKFSPIGKSGLKSAQLQKLTRRSVLIAWPD